MISRVYKILDRIPELPFFFVALAYIIFVPRTDYIHIFSTAFVFLAASLLFGCTLKLTFKTKRPKELTPIIFFKYGFPSLHAMTSVGAIGFVYFISPPLAILLSPVGLIFMASRVELHYHTRRDVWGGAAIGLLLGAAAGRYGLGIHFPPNLEFAFAVLFFTTPVVFSFFRVKHKI